MAVPWWEYRDIEYFELFVTHVFTKENAAKILTRNYDTDHLTMCYHKIHHETSDWLFDLTILDIPYKKN